MENKTDSIPQQKSETIEAIREHQILVEYRSLKQYSPQGVYILPQLQNLRIWNGVIFLKSGEYKGAVFKFKINIPEEYPNKAPDLFFNTYVFHPLVDPNSGLLNIKPKFSSWRPKEDFIFLLLWYMKGIFHSKQYWLEEHALNSTAWQIFVQDESLFQKEVKICVMVSKEDIDENDSESLIRFKNFNSFHKQILQEFRQTDPNSSEDERCREFINWFRDKFCN